MPVGNMSVATRASRELTACRKQLQRALSDLADMKTAYNHEAIKHMPVDNHPNSIPRTSTHFDHIDLPRGNTTELAYAIGKSARRAVALRAVREHVHDLIALTPKTEGTSCGGTATKSKVTVLHRAVGVVRNQLKTNLDRSRKRIKLEVQKFPSQHAAFKSVLLHAGESLNLPRLTVPAEKCMEEGDKTHEIRSAHEYGKIFNTTPPTANQAHQPRASTRRVVMFDGRDHGRMFAVLHDGERYESALHAAEDIGIRRLVKLGVGASEQELYHAYNQATASKERACDQVFALPVTLLYPLPKVETLVSLANTLIYAFKLPENFLRVKPVDSLKLAHAMFPHLFPMTT
jgi:hypothetical protein